MSLPSNLRRFGLLALALGASAPALAVDPPPVVCVVGQVCGDRCIAWTEVCSAGLAATAGLTPPAVGEPAAPAGATTGSTLLGLPAPLPARGPSFRPDAPEYCLTGSGTQQVPAECMAYYQLGASAGLVTTAPSPPECMQHLRCAGVCLKEGEVCPAHEAVDMQRTDGRTDAPPAPGFR